MASASKSIQKVTCLVIRRRIRSALTVLCFNLLLPVFIFRNIIKCACAYLKQSFRELSSDTRENKRSCKRWLDYNTLIFNTLYEFLQLISLRLSLNIDLNHRIY